MEIEVLIAGVEPKIVRFRHEEGECAGECSYDLMLYNLNQPISHRPEYLAARGKNSCHIQLIIKIDQSKSDFERGLIVPEGKPDKVLIRLKTKDENLEGKIWYTSFRTLLTHVSTDEFILEKSEPIITRVITEKREILCNGYSCLHISYCRFFNHSITATYKSTN